MCQNFQAPAVTYSYRVTRIIMDDFQSQNLCVANLMKTNCHRRAIFTQNLTKFFYTVIPNLYFSVKCTCNTFVIAFKIVICIMTFCNEDIKQYITIFLTIVSFLLCWDSSDLLCLLAVGFSLVVWLAFANYFLLYRSLLIRWLHLRN